MFLYSLTSYCIDDLCLQSGTLYGPFDTAAQRDEAMRDKLCHTDLETGYTVSVLKIDIVDGTVTSTSFIADPDEFPYDMGDDTGEGDDDDSSEGDDDEGDE